MEPRSSPYEEIGMASASPDFLQYASQPGVTRPQMYEYLKTTRPDTVAAAENELKRSLEEDDDTGFLSSLGNFISTSTKIGGLAAVTMGQLVTGLGAAVEQGLFGPPEGDDAYRPMQNKLLLLRMAQQYLSADEEIARGNASIEARKQKRKQEREDAGYEAEYMPMVDPLTGVTIVPEASEFVADVATDVADYVSAATETIIDDPAGGAASVGSLAAQTLPTVAASMAAYATAGPAGGLVAGSLMEIGGQFSDALVDQETGGIRELTGRDAALAISTGTLAGMVEMIGARGAVKAIGSLADSAALSSGMKKAFKRELINDVMQIAKSGGTEGVTEAIQTVITNIGAKYGWDPDRVYTEGVGESFVAGLIASGATVTAGKGISSVGNRLSPSTADIRDGRQQLPTPAADPAMVQQIQEAATQLDNNQLIEVVEAAEEGDIRGDIAAQELANREDIVNADPEGAALEYEQLSTQKKVIKDGAEAAAEPAAEPAATPEAAGEPAAEEAAPAIQVRQGGVGEGEAENVGGTVEDGGSLQLVRRGDETSAVKTDYSITPQGLGTRRVLELSEEEGPAYFRSSMVSALEANPYRVAVDVYDDYSGIKVFVSEDSQAGVAVKPDGDIVSVFSSGASNKGFVEYGLNAAVANGGTHLDAYDTVLPILYGMSGFRAVARVPFNDEYAPPGWDYDLFGEYNGGRPDVVFMVYDPENASPYKAGDGVMVESYEQGQALQRQEVDKIQGQYAPPGPTASVSARVRYADVYQKMAAKSDEEIVSAGSDPQASPVVVAAAFNHAVSRGLDAQVQRPPIYMPTRQFAPDAEMSQISDVDLVDMADRMGIPDAANQNPIILRGKMSDALYSGSVVDTIPAGATMDQSLDHVAVHSQNRYEVLDAMVIAREQGTQSEIYQKLSSRYTELTGKAPSSMEQRQWDRVRNSTLYQNAQLSEDLPAIASTFLSRTGVDMSQATYAELEAMADDVMLMGLGQTTSFPEAVSYLSEQDITTSDRIRLSNEIRKQADELFDRQAGQGAFAPQQAPSVFGAALPAPASSAGATAETQVIAALGAEATTRRDNGVGYSSFRSMFAEAKQLAARLANSSTCK